MSSENQNVSTLLDGVKHVHFIGCGGAGMFPLVQILHAKGYVLSGSDVEETKITDSERAIGMTVSIGHDPANLGDADLVVYSAAIHTDNVERKEAVARGIRSVERSVLLGYVSSLYPKSIGVAGTHGKTTTTGLITDVLERSGKDPAAVIGGKLPLIGGYGKAGNSDTCVIEACEYSRTFLQLRPYIGVLLNVDNDHLEYFGSMENLKAAFRDFCELSQIVVYNIDDENSCEVVDGLDCELVTFGIDATNAMYRAVNIAEWRPGFYGFDVYAKGEYFAHLKLGFPGYHNVYNALAMCACAVILGCTATEIATSASAFGGMGRRFEIKGTCNGAVIVDDYGHHPAEIAATLETASKMNYKRIIAVHQPFTFSRTRNLMNEFVDVLNRADQVVLLPIMGSREVSDGTVHASDLAARLDNCILVDGLEESAQLIKAIGKEGDLVVCMSCGDLYKAADRMVELG